MRVLRPAACTAALVLSLAACSSGNEVTSDADTLRSIFARLAPTGQDAPQPAPQPAQVLAATTAPVAIVRIEDRQAAAAILQIEANGPYRTYATAARQTVTLRDGIVTGTRGLGGDLMSSDLGQVSRLVTARAAGRSQHVMRFLDGENQTRALPFDCTVTPGETVATGPGTSALRVSESCTYRDLQITNRYLVDGAGRVVGSRQWLGPHTGYVSIQHLRL